MLCIFKRPTIKCPATATEKKKKKEEKTVSRIK